MTNYAKARYAYIKRLKRRNIIKYVPTERQLKLMGYTDQAIQEKADKMKHTYNCR